MPDKLPVGPYRTIEIDDGVQAPFYIIPFDEQGICQGPLTRDHLLTTLQNGAFTDIFLFSHGWNNDWKIATDLYDGFLSGYAQMQREHGLTYSRPFRPLLIGIFWPSIALVSPSESGPAIAAFSGDSTQLMDVEVGQERQEIQSLAANLAKEDVERFYALAQRGQDLNSDEAMELARMLSPIYNSTAEDELPTVDSAPSTEQLMSLWQKIASMASTKPSTGTPGKFGFVNEPGRTPGVGGLTTQSTSAPEAAGILDFLDPMLIIRLATVLQMKDRAGVVGAHGVGSLLFDVLKNGTTRVHLIGHSYGCKVVLSALCFQELPRPVHSVLLLQPAISYLCFAVDATGTGLKGGYRVALHRVEQSIMTTYSPRDVPLTQFFHLAVRRSSDLGEEQIAGAPPPSRYAALGGFGPGGCETDCSEVEMKKIGDLYDLGPGVRIIHVLNGVHAISGHGDISNDFTWWALYNQVTS